MNGSSDDISLIIFALLAVFVIWKLRSVLGTRTGHEQPPYDPVGQPRSKVDSSARGGAEENRVVRLPGAAPEPLSVRQPMLADDRWKGLAQPGSPVWVGLDAIASADPSFDPGGFLRGASSAYEMIIVAFAKRDRETLRNLLSQEVYDSFDKAMGESEAKGEIQETTIVSVEPGAFEEAHQKDDMAQLSVRFASKLISLTRDRGGAVTDGSPDKVVDHLDNWTFARSVRSRDPNWKLVATQSLP